MWGSTEDYIVFQFGSSSRRRLLETILYSNTLCAWGFPYTARKAQDLVDPCQTELQSGVESSNFDLKPYIKKPFNPRGSWTQAAFSLSGAKNFSHETLPGKICMLALMWSCRETLSVTAETENQNVSAEPELCFCQETPFVRSWCLLLLHLCCAKLPLALIHEEKGIQQLPGFIIYVNSGLEPISLVCYSAPLMSGSSWDLGQQPLRSRAVSSYIYK